MPVALMTRPMMISLSAIAELPPSPCLDGPSPSSGGTSPTSFGYLVSAREHGRRHVEAKPARLTRMHAEIETLATSPTCRALIFNVGRSLRLAYPVTGGVRSPVRRRPTRDPARAATITTT